MKTHITLTKRIRPGGGIKAMLAALALLAVAASPALAGDGNVGNPGILPPQSRPHGLGYADWAAKWEQWSLAFPADADPANDTAPQDSAQSGEVWFLAGAHGSAVVGGTAIVTRQITVPAGKSLFFPIIVNLQDNSDCPTYDSFTVDELRAHATASWAHVTETSCTIDGVAVSGLENPQTTPYLVASTVFSYTVADHDNILAADLGEPCIPDGTTVDSAVALGAFLMLAPLPPGPHTIHLVGIVGPLASPFVDKDLTYDITVTP